MAGRIRLTAFLLGTVLAFGQSLPDPQQNVIHLDVNLVQIDAVVTDAAGRHKTDLTAADFEILQDGKPQTISNLTYIKSPPVSIVRNATGTKPAAAGAPPFAAPPLQAANLRRATAMVVDDRGLSADSMLQVRAELKRFVSGQIDPGDLVAISRIGLAIGSLPQFTSDPRLLNAAIEDLRYSAASRAGSPAIAPIKGRFGWFTDRNVAGHQKFSDLETIDTLRYLVNSASALPGRKLMIVFSESLPLIFARDIDVRVMNSLRRLTDAAGRASVVISVIDPRGVQYTGLTSADEIHGFTNEAMMKIQVQRAAGIVNSQEGLSFIAQDTGGLFLHDMNDLDLAIRKVMSDSDGYYLIGYRPDASTFQQHEGQPQFHKVEVKVRAPGLKVRSRGGFYSSRPPESPAPDEITKALLSPVAADALRVRATALFSENSKEGEFLNVLVYVDPRDITVGANGGSIRLMAAAVGENGQVIDTQDRTCPIQISERAEGTVYAIHQSVRRAGVYEVRVAVRDLNSGRVGSARGIVDAPDLKAGRLALSSILLQEQSPGAAISLVSSSEGRLPVGNANGSAAVRVFRPGAKIAYAYVIFNARAGAVKSAELEAQTRIFRDGEQVYASKPALVDAAHQPDPRRLVSRWATTLGNALGPGNYVLQVVVTDHRAPERQRTASQYIDFTVE